MQSEKRALCEFEMRHDIIPSLRVQSRIRPQVIKAKAEELMNDGICVRVLLACKIKV